MPRFGSFEISDDKPCSGERLGCHGYLWGDKVLNSGAGGPRGEFVDPLGNAFDLEVALGCVFSHSRRDVAA